MKYDKADMIAVLTLFVIGALAAGPGAYDTAAAATSQLSQQEALDKGLSFKAWFGGWEPDYTKTAGEVMLGYKAVPSLHLYAGGGYADQIYYETRKVYAKGYYFYENNSYLKFSAGYKQYTYPVDAALQRPNPDSSSYLDVPNAEVEVAHWFHERLRGTAFVEYFRPDFYHDSAAYANNVKTGVEAYYLTPLDGLRVKIMYALLRDPDPNKTEIKGRDNYATPAPTATRTQVVYRTTDLLGGALEAEEGRWQGEVKYLPNRDLDNSYDYSVLTYVACRFTERTLGRADYVYDRYSSDSNYAGKTAHVYLLSAYYDATPALTLGLGVKYIDLPSRNDGTGFISLSYKTGVVF